MQRKVLIFGATGEIGGRIARLCADAGHQVTGVTMERRLDFLLEHMCFDIGKAERVLGYAPTHTTEQGLIKALEWCESSGLL
jgi:nucleoside-diphosphate-sugar epimerase